MGAHCHVTAHAVLAAGDEVVAVIQLVVGVPKDGRVARQRLALIETHACSQARRVDAAAKLAAVLELVSGVPHNAEDAER